MSLLGDTYTLQKKSVTLMIHEPGPWTWQAIGQNLLSNALEGSDFGWWSASGITGRAYRHVSWCMIDVWLYVVQSSTSSIMTFQGNESSRAKDWGQQLANLLAGNALRHLSTLASVTAVMPAMAQASIRACLPMDRLEAVKPTQS